MADAIQVLSEQSIAALKRDHERLRYEVRHLRTILRAFMSASGDSGGLKEFCRFTLNADLSTSDATKAATITEQWGRGRDHSTASAITVHNLLSHAGGVYVFEGASGNAGIASYDPDLKAWRIIIPECP